MFQKELGEKIIGKFETKNYGRISILTSLRLRLLKKFLSHQIVLDQNRRLVLLYSLKTKKNAF